MTLERNVATRGLAEHLAADQNAWKYVFFPGF